ncbi:BnaC05g26080D [Brassica napus]|uniref:(rape) hypothetical protein n=1 Tax=Brassica napus TaxID=3708 RepID=A0A078G636_BRANA|nr:unnamed protein product [Brassica napus]CDY20884.1 BnaC05g26080D [Brassica napus]
MNTTQYTSEFLTIFGKYLGKAYLISLRYTTLVKYYYVYFAIQRFLQEKNMSLINGTNSIALLSVMVGLPFLFITQNSGAHLERRHALYSNKYVLGYQVKLVGLHGEQVNVYTDHGAATNQWKQYTDYKIQPLTWYKVLKKQAVLGQYITRFYTYDLQPLIMI